jgi:hypothetical protein
MWDMGNVAKILEEFTAVDRGSMYFQNDCLHPQDAKIQDSHHQSKEMSDISSQRCWERNELNFSCLMVLLLSLINEQFFSVYF